MDDLLKDYVSYELFEEALCNSTDAPCPDCESTLLLDHERQRFLCPDCRSEFVAENG